MADIKVNEAEWGSLSNEDRNKIKQIITGIFKENHNIVPDSNSSESSKTLGSGSDLSAAFSNPFCNAACNAAESVAVAACGALSGPAIPICIAAAHAAGEFCRSKC